MYRALPVCQSCWNKQHPDRAASALVEGPPEHCVVCELPTRDGIYVRMQVLWATAQPLDAQSSDSAPELPGASTGR